MPIFHLILQINTTPTNTGRIATQTRAATDCNAVESSGLINYRQFAKMK